MSSSDTQAAVAEQLTAHDHLALCLDFDGTLAPIVSDPTEAELPAKTRELLSQLAEQPSVDLAVISGRALADIRSRVGVDGIEYAGNHGLEVDRGDEVWVHPVVERHRDALAGVLDEIEPKVESISGCLIEDKYATAAVHLRRIGTDDSSHVIAHVQAVVDGVEPISMHVDNKTIELRPAIDHGKGEAIERIVDTAPETLVIYLGDAQTDVDAFRTLDEMDDETVQIAVGSDLPATGHRLDSPEDVQEFLQWLVVELDGE